MEGIKRGLARIVGRRNVSDSQKALGSNSTDATLIPSEPPLLVVYPRSPREVEAVVALANRTLTPLVPRGGGSGLCGGACAQGGVVVNLTRMDRVLRINRKRGSVTVQPGIILDKLERILAKEGLMMPVRPASHALATIGGMVSTDAGGENVIRFGRMHENILSLKAVTGGGRLVEARGRRIRDFCGTEGIIGIVVEAELRVLPLIRRRSVTVREPSGRDELLALVERFRRERDVIAVEFINPVLHSMIRRRKTYFLLVEFAGGGGEVKEARLMRGLWAVREGCNPLLTRKGWGLNADPQIPREALPEFLGWCEKEGLPAFGHIGHGVLHVHAKDAPEMDRMYALVKRLGGLVSGEHGIGLTKKRYLPREREEELGKLKGSLDPNRTLNKGKMIG